MLKLHSAITPVKFYGFFLKSYSGDLLIISYQLTKFQASSLNPFLDILLTRFFSILSKGHNFKMGDNSEKKKNICLLFFMRNPYMKFQDSSFNGLKVTVGTRKCDAPTHTPKAICPINFFKVGGINNENEK